MKISINGIVAEVASFVPPSLQFTTRVHLDTRKALESVLFENLKDVPSKITIDVDVLHDIQNGSEEPSPVIITGDDAHLRNLIQGFGDTIRITGEGGDGVTKTFKLTGCVTTISSNFTQLDIAWKTCKTIDHESTGTQ